MRTIQTLFKIIIFVLIPLDVIANTFDNFFSITSGISSFHKYLSIEGGINKIFVGKANVKFLDYGEIQNYSVINSEYYIKTLSFKLSEITIDSSFGVSFNNIIPFIILKASIVNAITQDIALYYGLGLAASYKDEIYTEIEIRDINIFLNDFRVSLFLSYSNSFFKELSLRLSKDTISMPTFEIMSEVEVLNLGDSRVNLGVGYTSGFGNFSLLPYIMVVRLLLPLGFEVLSKTKFSTSLLDTSVSLKYKFF